VTYQDSSLSPETLKAKGYIVPDKYVKLISVR
jgi:hypothetical protein